MASPLPTAQTVMSSPVHTVAPQTSVAEAQRLLLRWGHAGLCVVDGPESAHPGRLVGMVSRRDLDLAQHHGLGARPVGCYAAAVVEAIAPDTPLSEVERLMITHDLGRLPVLYQNELVGLVTRTDLLRGKHLGEPGERWPQLSEALDAPLSSLLQQAAAIAQARGWHLYLVGGAVRDLLLGDLQLSDIDLVVDGFHRSVTPAAGVELAQALQAHYPEARLEIHGKFQTAALLWRGEDGRGQDGRGEDGRGDGRGNGRGGDLDLDFATARTEFYAYPAANPAVEACSIHQDLYRRDFTINALAVQLTQPQAGTLLDRFGGRRDLGDRKIRVLHALSFVEDPTRIFRAIRFAVRLGFELEPQTRRWVIDALESGIYEQTQADHAAVPALQTRLRSELKYLLSAPYRNSALKLAGELGALRCLHPSLRFTPALRGQLRWLDWGMQRGLGGDRPVPPWLLRLELLLTPLSAEARLATATQLRLPPESLQRLAALAPSDLNPSPLVLALRGLAHPSQIYSLLCPHDPALLLLVAAGTGRGGRPQRRKIWTYLSQWRNQKPLLSGNDLKKMGYQPGKRFKTILHRLLMAQLDGVVETQAVARRWVGDRFPLA